MQEHIEIKARNAHPYNWSHFQVGAPMGKG